MNNRDMSKEDSYAMFGRKGRKSWNEFIYGKYPSDGMDEDAAEDNKEQYSCHQDAGSSGMDSARLVQSQPCSGGSYQHDRQPSDSSIYCAEHFNRMMEAEKLAQAQAMADEDRVPCSLGLPGSSAGSSPVMLAQPSSPAPARVMSAPPNVRGRLREGAPCASEEEGLRTLNLRLISDYEKAFKEKMLLLEKLGKMSEQLLAMDTDIEDQTKECEWFCEALSRKYDDDMNRLHREAKAATDDLHQKFQARGTLLRANYHEACKALQSEFDNEADTLNASLDGKRAAIENKKNQAIEVADKNNKEITAGIKANFDKVKAEMQAAQDKIDAYDRQIDEAMRGLGDCNSYTAMFVRKNFKF